jgi:hypothetical protein
MELPFKLLPSSSVTTGESVENNASGSGNNVSTKTSRNRTFSFMNEVTIKTSQNWTAVAVRKFRTIITTSTKERPKQQLIIPLFWDVSNYSDYDKLMDVKTI